MNIVREFQTQAFYVGKLKYIVIISLCNFLLKRPVMIPSFFSIFVPSLGKGIYAYSLFKIGSHFPVRVGYVLTIKSRIRYM